MSPTPWLSTTVSTAGEAVHDGAHRGGGELGPMSVSDLAELGGSLRDLLAGLTTWTGRAAPQVADLPAAGALHDDSGTADPRARCLQAADHLDEVSTHLAAAQAAAAAYHAAIGHLAQDGVGTD